MKAEDTAKTYGELMHYCIDKGIKEPVDYDLNLAQAEISFKAGYQQALQEHEWDDNYYLGKTAGIKEVVDWIQKHQPYMAFHCNKDWQSQLKEWK